MSLKKPDTYTTSSPATMRHPPSLPTGVTQSVARPVLRETAANDVRAAPPMFEKSPAQYTVSAVTSIP
jgi:hypothetical protein